MNTLPARTTAARLSVTRRSVQPAVLSLGSQLAKTRGLLACSASAAAGGPAPAPEEPSNGVPKNFSTINASRSSSVQTATVAEAPRKAPASTLFALPDEDVECDPEDPTCQAFVDRSGEFVEVMCCDYGFRSGTGRFLADTSGELPFSAWELAVGNFKLELEALRRSFRYDEYNQIATQNPPQGPLGQLSAAVGKTVVTLLAALDKGLEGGKFLAKLEPEKAPAEVADASGTTVNTECKDIRERLKQLKLSNQAVWDREHKREAEGGGVPTPWYVKAVYLSLCLFLDWAYENRPIQRFWFLETVARMPYFSYISILHLYESLGWWRAGAELRKVHFAEEWNEFHHLQIMESLGGDQLWIDRFLGNHAAIVYYWILVALFIFSPRLAYNFSELIEAHAVDTYGEFCDANEELLKSLPPPLVAVTYYRSDDLYMFDEFQTAARKEPRRPDCNTLYDVFANIRDDEGEHVKTMHACQDRSVMAELTLRRDKGRSL